jgi:hypothetical protein
VNSVQDKDSHSDAPARQLGLEAMSAQAMRLLEQVPVGEGTGAKLSRLLEGFLESDVLPQARRAADYGIDPTPLLAVVADVLRLYADSLRPPDPADYCGSDQAVQRSGVEAEEGPR